MLNTFTVVAKYSGYRLKMDLIWYGLATQLNRVAFMNHGKLSSIQNVSDFANQPGGIRAVFKQTLEKQQGPIYEPGSN